MKTDCFTFRNSRFAPCEVDPLGDGDTHDQLARLGYMRGQSVGEDAGVSYELYEANDEGGWAVVFKSTLRFCVIFCHEWPDLIELLAKLSFVPLMSPGGDLPLSRPEEAL